MKEVTLKDALANSLLSNEQKKLLLDLTVGSEPEKVVNPYSLQSCMLCPLAVALYDLVKGAEMIGDRKNLLLGLGAFRLLWPDEYYTLLD